MQLIKESKLWHRMWSVRFALLSAFFGAVELSLPLFNGVISDKIFATISLVLAICSACARVFPQSNLNATNEQSSTTNPPE